MDNFTNSEVRVEMTALLDHPILLWLKQNVRKVTRRPPLQESLLDAVLRQARANEAILGVLLFGSVATKTHRWNSDIDLIFIYEDHDPPSGLVDYFVDGVLVQYFYVTLECLLENQKTVPYLLHMFTEGVVLFDRHGNVTPVVNELKQYYAAHPGVEAEWVHIKELHQVEKMGSQCEETTIIHRWDQLEEKYSGGELKRTFFVMKTPAVDVPGKDASSAP